MSILLFISAPFIFVVLLVPKTAHAIWNEQMTRMNFELKLGIEP